MAVPLSKVNVFALIIGINNYHSRDDFGTLQGAVNDARTFEKFLLDPHDKRGLGVPRSNVLTIEDRKATRANILAAFKAHLLDNKAIPDHGDATMILFYAGHGSRIEAPGNWGTTDGKVEAICPVDERTTDAAGNYVHTIPDYVLAWLLRDLAQKKGPNITVILDSCHSGGMGRDVGQARNARSLSPFVPLELDSHLWSDKTSTAAAYSMWEPGADSHVLLAACRQEETAREIRYTDKSVHGRFTERLIFHLRRAPLGTTTYAELLNMFPEWSGQTPHCGGARKDRLVFDWNYPATGRSALPLTIIKAPGVQPKTVAGRGEPKDPDEAPLLVDSYSIDMGTVEGVVPGTEFEARAADNTLLGSLTARSVHMSHSILSASDPFHAPVIPPGSRAAVSDWNNHAIVLHVYAPRDFPHLADLFPTGSTDGTRRRKYVQAPSREEAQIALRAADKPGEVLVERLTSTFLEYSPTVRFALADQAKCVHLPNVVDGIAHFNYFLERRHGADPLPGVTLAVHRLEGEVPGRRPDRRYGDDGNLVVNHEVRLLSEPDAQVWYGFTIRNEGPEDLFAYLFYFDPDMYTITRWHAPAGARVYPPLKHGGGTITVGMGSEAAYRFSLPQGQHASSGFLKVFVSSKYLDLDWIQQRRSPFHPDFRGTQRLEMIKERLPEMPKWDAFCVALTMTDGELGRHGGAGLEGGSSGEETGLAADAKREAETDIWYVPSLC
ncbi:caspase domain-containing protein [Mycena belliarum]|uniref:Caspase domain-containing protein n=1 Tax=Mycena belliarum TaxID=1033014 RepID=A0AAD6UAP6_9AGAR|nr:caspase domain-containing protein [Mycena belliae]